ncbi:MAG: acyl carrier protein [Bacteroidetes bacterium]|nr:MAG: acyl carrier protein [Bacteroidota bacterium]
MTNLERYNKVFTDTFNIEVSELNDDFNTDEIAEWDSVTQLALVEALEDEFEIMFDTEDILNFKSYTEGRSILLKYQIDLEE